MRSLWSRRDLLALEDQHSRIDPAEIVHIASLVVQFAPRACESVRRAIADLPGAQLHESAHPGKWVVLLESADERAIAGAVEELSQVSGVLTVSVVAHLMETASALEEEVESESTTVSKA